MLAAQKSGVFFFQVFFSSTPGPPRIFYFVIRHRLSYHTMVRLLFLCPYRFFFFVLQVFCSFFFWIRSGLPNRVRHAGLPDRLHVDLDLEELRGGHAILLRAHPSGGHGQEPGAAHGQHLDANHEGRCSHDFISYGNIRYNFRSINKRQQLSHIISCHTSQAVPCFFLPIGAAFSV